MRSVQEHLDEVRKQVRPVDAVTVPVAQAAGLVLAKDVTSPVDLPRFDTSSMDGYAVVAADLDGVDEEHPTSMPVAGDIPAGDTTPHTVQRGQVWRIMTGAPLPEGADAVVPLEDTDNRPREVLIRRAPEQGAYLRRAGEDLRAGEVIVPKGASLGPAQLAGIVAAGVPEVTVTGPVRVVVLSTGDELTSIGEPVGPGQIVDCNGPMLVAAVRAAGHYAVHVGQLADDETTIRQEIGRHLSYADAIITTGGVSKGAYDAVKAVLSGKGSMWFGEVAMQPGKPQGFGLLGKRKVPVFALPGNPVSALVSFEVFVRPALAWRAGAGYRPQTLTAIVAKGWASPEGKQQYARVRLIGDPTGAYAVEPAGAAGSHLVGALATADGLAVVAPEETEVVTGTQVTVIPLRPLTEIEARLEAERSSAGSDEDASGAAAPEGGR